MSNITGRSIGTESATRYLLTALIPYTEANLTLVFKPGRFFDELARHSDQPPRRQTIRTAYYRAIKQGLITFDDTGVPRLTEKATGQLKKFVPQKLGSDAKILLIFDIPETEKKKRDRLRTLLRELYFEQIQKSAWQTEYDVIGYLTMEIASNNLEEYVEIFEASRIKVR